MQTFIAAAPGAARQRLIAEHTEARAQEFRTALLTAARTHAAQGRRSEAVRAYEAAFELAELTSVPRGMMSALLGLGMVYGQAGDYRNAEKYLRSLAIKERVSPPDDVISTIGNIGSVYAMQGNGLQALEYLDKALVLAQQA